MVRYPISRSGRPSPAAGPLVSAVVGVLATVGLGCAAVGAAATPAPAYRVPHAEAADGSSVPAATGTRSLELRRPSDKGVTGPPDAGSRGTSQSATAAAARTPAVPVIDVSPRQPTDRRKDQPVRLRVDAADLDVEVRASGVAEDGSMELPGTVRRAGWYRYSSLPGSRAGSTVIAAHVDTRAEGLGPFARLTALRRGDRVVVLDRSGDAHRYRVQSRRLITRTRLPIEEVFDRDGSPRLVLITCGGAYDSENGYRDNVVVVALPDR